MTFSELVQQALHGKRYRIKAHIRVAPKYARDAKGRFTGGLARKGYSRRIYDRDAPKVSGLQLMGENVMAHNALLGRLQAHFHQST